MKTRLSILLLASLFLSGCGATAVPTATLVQSTPTVLAPQEPTSTVSIVTPTLDIATILVAEPSATPESTMTPQATATIGQVKMEVLPDGQQTGLPPPEVCQRPPQNWVAYTVARNDTLSSLGQRTGTSWQQIQSANCLTSTTIFSGQTLYLPFIPPTLAVTNLPSPQPSRVPPGPGDPTVIMLPTSGPPATKFKIVITDFKANEAITIRIFDADTGDMVFEKPTVVNDMGDLIEYFPSPADPAAVGDYSVDVSGITSAATGSFTITNS
jgi:LysM repeat protein